MKKLALIVAAAAVVLAGVGTGASSARAQATGPDAIDPIYALSLTEAINNHNAALVLEHFVKGGTVVFDNSMFGLPNKTLTAAEYAARQRADEPDVPTDIHLEITDRSLEINATSATWLWRETAGFLGDINVDYIEFNVLATTENHRFKSIHITPSNESLAKLISLAPTTESLARLPYSPALPTLPFTLDGDANLGLGPSAAVVRLESPDGSQARGGAILTGNGTTGGTTVSLHVSGLTAGTPAQASLHAGTCTTPGASLAALPALVPGTPSATSAAATGALLFRGTESVALAAVADGEHVISISQSGQVVACGLVPQVEGAPTGPVGMPRTGGPADLAVLLVLVLAALGLILGGAQMWARSKS
ncbi:MAG TPA: hypothetical protein VF914_00635 [Chloroflexia bacterium]|jgi:hypothetical protein